MKITIPDGLKFADLKLQRTPLGDIVYERGPIHAICKASGIDPATMEIEDNLTTLFALWYAEARKRGEPADPVFEQLIAEALSENN